MTDDKDRRTLMTLLSVYYSPKVVTDPLYTFSSSGIYRVPNDTSSQGIIKYIQELPFDVKPEVFNLHENADITKNQIETDNFFQAILTTQARVEGGGKKSSEEIIIELACEMLKKLPEPLDIRLVSMKYPASYSESMNTVLLQEIIRFKGLTEVIRESLSNIQKAVKGLVVMSSALEDVASSMLVGQIPKSWLSKSYPSQKPLSGYYQDLLNRLSFFRKWIERGPPVTFWLSGFFFTQSFLTGCLQNYARKYTIPIDLLAFEFHIQTQKTSDVRPEEGQYVYGLYLEGARWDIDANSIVESHPRVLTDQLPLIWLKPGERSKFCLEKTYDCPVYKTSARRGVLSTTG